MSVRAVALAVTCSILMDLDQGWRAWAR